MPNTTISQQSTQSSDKMIKKIQEFQGKKDYGMAKKSFDLRTILELPGPKRALSGYIMFVKERMPQLVQDGVNYDKHQDRMKVLAAEWNQLGQLQEKYVSFAENDKKRYKDQCEELDKKGYFTMKNGMQSNQVLSQYPKFLESVVQPKKPINAYIFFSNQCQKQILQNDPSMSLMESSKRVSELWKKLEDSEREKFEKMAQKDKLRFENELKDLLTRGYFIMQDGSKSCEHVRIVKKKREFKQQTQNDLDEEMLDEMEEKLPKSAKSPKSTQSSKVKPVVEDQPKSSKQIEKKASPIKLSTEKSSKAFGSTISDTSSILGMPNKVIYSENQRKDLALFDRFDRLRQIYTKEQREDMEAFDKCFQSLEQMRAEQAKEDQEKKRKAAAISQKDNQKFPKSPNSNYNKPADEKPRSFRHTKGKDLDRSESPNSKNRLSPSKNSKSLQSPISKPSTEKSIKQKNSLSKMNKERTPRSETGESPDTKKERQIPQSQSQSKSKLDVSPPKFLKEKSLASNNQNTSKGRKYVPSNSPQKSKQGKAPDSK